MLRRQVAAAMRRGARGVVLALVVASAAPVLGATDIVNGVYTSDYPTVGALLRGGDFATAGAWCTGTTIGCRTFLTAAHCVEGDLDPGHYSVFLQHGGFFNVSAVVVHPDYNFPVGDLAVLTLGTSADGIAPSAINTTATPPFGTDGTIVGFGRSGGAAEDYGLKRRGAVVTGSCPVDISNTTSVCWTFANPLDPPGSDSNTCNGDSGGPLFVDLGSGMSLAGVTSGGNSESCLPTDESYDVNVYHYGAWIAAEAGADLNNTACGALPQVGGVGTSVQGFTGSLNSVATQAALTVEVPPGMSEFRVALNAKDDGSDFDLYVRAGAAPTTSVYDCKADGPNQYGFCRFVAPADGTWHILVNRFSGSGPYQVTTTIFGTDCGNPLNAGQPCDDANACTANDVCAAGQCAGSAVANGLPCDDGAPCTHGDACQSGTCTGSGTPRSGCRTAVVAGRGSIDLQRNPERPQKLSWKWASGSATTKADFGDPTASTDVAICIYDDTAGVSQPVFAQLLQGGSSCGTRACWTATATGFSYRDSRGDAGPISKLVLRAGTDGRARISARGKGGLLGLPALPLAQQPAVTVQLNNGTTCWESRFTTNSDNNQIRFRGRE